MTGAFGNLVNRPSGLGQTNADSTTPPDVQLNIGPYRSGKTLAVIDEVIKFCRDNPFVTSIVVVPSQRYRKLFEQRLHERLFQVGGGTPGIIGLQILPFYKACELVLKRLDTTYKLVPEHVRVAVIARVLNRLKEQGQLQTLEPIIGFAGTHSALLELIDELQRAALLPDQVLEKLQETAQSEAKYVELAKVYQSYSQELAALGFSDERSIAFEARRLLSEPESRLDLGMVVADGFDRFNYLQLHVLDGLSRQARRARICFDYLRPEADREGEYVWKQESFAELETVFHHAAQLEIKSHVQANSAENSERITTRRKFLDRYFEAAEVARAIKQRLIDGAKPQDFLVVARSISVYAPAIHAAFESAGISYFLDEAIELHTLPSVQFILRLIELAAVKNFKRSEVLACFRSVNFRLSSVFETERDLNRLDKYSMKDKIVESREQWLEMFRQRAADFSKDLPTAFANFCADVQPAPYASLREHVVWVEDLIDRYYHQSTDVGDDQFVRWEEHRALAEFRRCLASLVQEENICGTESCSAEYFLSRLRTQVEKSNFRRLPRHLDHVTVCGADLAPNQMFEEVFMLGLAEGEFPRKVKQSGFLSVDELSGWLLFGIDLRNPRFHAAFEPALFNSLVKRSRKAVHLSCPMHEFSGEELLPSYLMTNGSEDLPIQYVAAHATPLVLPTCAREAVSAVLWSEPERDITELRAMLPVTTLIELLSEPIAIARSRQLAPVSHFNGDLSELVSTGALSVQVPKQWSATKLNDYGKCPFRYWITHVIGAQPLEEPEAKLDPMVLGETYHKALELFYRTLVARKLTLTSIQWEEAERLFLSAVNAALALLQQRTDVRHGEFWKYERNEITFRLKRFFFKEWQRAQQDQEQFVPILMEASFGLPDAQSHPHLKFVAGGREISVRGRIDRIDIANHTIGSDQPRVRIVDYKAGSTAISKDDAIKGRNIQLPLYALAVQQSILPGSEVASAMYLSVSSGEPIGKLSFDPDARDRNGVPVDFIDIARNHIGNFVDGIASGAYHVRPNNRSVCSRCDHKSVCRINELPETTSVSPTGDR